ncbi:TPA: AP-2 complex subunit beta [Trebouxia sp. C0004]
MKNVTEKTETQHRGPRGRSSVHRGVTQHRRTRKWEAHIWDDRHQVYLGGFNSEDDAARAHDVMAIKCRGADSITNYSPDDYSTLLPQLQKLTKVYDEVRQLLMRKSSTFARGVSKYRGVTKHKGGKWEARLGQSKTRKHSYLGLFDSEEDAAKAYDTATINRFGHGMAINFDLGQESTVPSNVCNSKLPHEVVSNSVPLPIACDFPLTLGSSSSSFYSSFPSPPAVIPNSPFATHVSSPDSPLATHMNSPLPVYTPATGRSDLYSSPRMGSPDPFMGLHSPTPPLGPHPISLRPMTPNDNLDQQFLLQPHSQTEFLGQTGSSSFCTQAAATAYQPVFANDYGDHSFAAHKGRYSLPDADMYTLHMTPKLANGPEELLHQPESSSSPVLKYTDWHKQAAPPGSSASAVQDDSWRSRLHNMDTSASPALSASASRPGVMLPKSLFNMLGGNDLEHDVRAFFTFSADTPKSDDLLGTSLSDSTGGGYFEVDKQTGVGIQGLEEADRQSTLLLFQAGQHMPGSSPYCSVPQRALYLSSFNDTPPGLPFLAPASQSAQADRKSGTDRMPSGTENCSSASGKYRGHAQSLAFGDNAPLWW